MIILTSFLGLAFTSFFFTICWLTDELAEYKHRVRFLENQNKELREVYKNALQTYKKRTKRN